MYITVLCGSPMVGTLFIQVCLKTVLIRLRNNFLSDVHVLTSTIYLATKLFHLNDYLSQ